MVEYGEIETEQAGDRSDQPFSLPQRQAEDGVHPGPAKYIYGRKPAFMVSINIFLLGSMLCRLAQGMTQLIVFRAIQGLGAGGLITLPQTTVGDLVPPRDRSRYEGLFASVFAGAAWPARCLGASSLLCSPGAGSSTSTSRSAQWLKPGSAVYGIAQPGTSPACVARTRAGPDRIATLLRYRQQCRRRC